ncbi:glycoside hydrolase family 2 protein [Annulohypoxylon stygium]|nr:glycoside hydrolase family 2 protein [Annulohypoxylon stygium]
MANKPVVHSRAPIEADWVFKEANSEQPFRPVSRFPTVNHLDLMHHGLIPDPARNKNARDIQWVGEREWIYKTTFDFSEKRSGENSHDEHDVRHVLVFEGLDTHCRISLNGQLLLRSDNMFLEWRIDVTDKLRRGSNDLELYFESTFLVGKQLEKDHGFKNLYWNGDSSRMNVRKVPCHYGWDWGPTLLTAGPWRPIYLETFVTRISDLGIDIEVLDTLDTAIITVSIELEGADVDTATTLLEISDPSGRKTVHGETQGCESCCFIVQEPSLWYPLGYGVQPLYTIKATIGGGLHEVTKRAGLRLIELVQRPLPGQKGLTFFFRVNNIPIYSQGTDWIPPDVFLPRMTLQRYRDWLTWAARGNQNMIRVWGGGIYEDDRFYDTCDELGILVWQDFMMGCGAYPYHDYLVKSIKAEADNEDYMFAELHNLEYDPKDDNPEHWIKSNFPGRHYYEVILKQVVETLAPRVPYHLSSPYGGSSSNDPTVGDIHSWRVWMADQPRYPYQDYEKLTGRFVSEFGMKSFPCFRTIRALIDYSDERHPQSSTMDMWHMAPKDQRTMSMYLVDNLRHGNDIKAYSWATQVIQAESTDYSSRAFRRLWRGPGKEECAGCLIWQLNDCYPAVSWSLLDSAMRPKLAYYVSRRNYAPLLVGATRRVAEKKANEFTHVDIEPTFYAELWASNLTLNPVEADLDIWFVMLSSGFCVQSDTRAVTLLPNRSTEFETVEFPDWFQYSSAASSLVVHLRLRERDGSQRVLARYTEFPQPLRHHDFSGAKVFIKPLPDGRSWSVGAIDDVVKAVELSVATDDDDLVDACLFSDNYLDLVPGDDQVITVDIKGPVKIPQGGLKLVEKHYG